MKNQSEFLELVKKRFSVRDFCEKPVEREKIELCLEAARLAPSACNSQPWKFIIIDEPTTKNKLCDRIFGGTYSTNTFAKKAPVIVVVLSEKSSFIASVGAWLRDTRYYLIDIGIAVEHFALQAAELGLGTCWLGWFDEKKLKEILNIPAVKKIDVILALGYTNSLVGEKSRKSLEKIVSYNRFE